MTEYITYITQVRSLHGIWEDWAEDKKQPNFGAAACKEADRWKRDWRVLRVISSVIDTTEGDIVDSENSQLINFAEAKLRSVGESSVSVSAGYKLVPLICTPEIEAVYGNDNGAYQTAQELHDAMLSAVDY